MKKIFIQFWQWILKHRKRLIYGALAFFVGQICFLGIGGIGNSVFAEGSDQTLEEKMEEKLNTWKNGLSFIVKMVYILIYPLLVLAGKLVDNSFVYGEVIGFDAVLWQLWNMVRNLANFTLGFIFIYKIFEFLIKGQKIGDIKKLLISSLIAGIGIQASWFLMAALIDVSTILTYSVGGLPISILEETAGGNAEDKLYKYNPYVLKTVLDVDAKNIDDMHLYFTNSSGSFYISECKTFIYELSGEKEELILAPEMIYYKANSGDYKPTDAYRCHYNGQIYYFENLYEGIENAENFPGLDTEGNGRFRDCSPNCGTQQNNYKALLEIAPGDMKEKNVDVETLIVGGRVLEIGDAHMTGGILRSLFNVDVYSQDQKRGLDVGNEWTGTGGNATRLQDILDGKSYVGVFSALYSSLIASGRTTISQFSNASSYFLDVLNAAFSVLYVLAISIPLMVVAIVFLMRIGVLWLAISFSPFIVLLTAFDLFKSESIKKIKLLEYLSLENLIPIIFSPAIICFAISISTVLFIIITEKNTELGEIDGNLMLGLFSVKIADGPVKLSQLVVAVLGVAITWFIVWAAIETSKLGKSSVVQGLKSFVTGELGAMPIVPIPGKDGKVSYMGLGTVFGRDGQGGILSNINNKIKNKYEGESNEAIDALLDPEKAAKDAEAKNLKAYKAGLTSRSIDENWMNAQVMIGEKKDTPKTFNDFEESEQESIIEEINGLGKARLEGRIPIDNEVTLKSGKRYKFVTQRKRMKDNKPVLDADGKPVMDDVYKYEKVDEGQKSS